MFLIHQNNSPQLVVPPWYFSLENTFGKIIIKRENLRLFQSKVKLRLFSQKQSSENLCKRLPVNGEIVLIAELH